MFIGKDNQSNEHGDAGFDATPTTHNALTIGADFLRGVAVTGTLIVLAPRAHDAVLPAHKDSL